MSSDKREYTRKVMELVKSRLQDKPWYRGVCLDSIDGSFDAGYSVEKAAEVAETETIIWDGPWPGSR